MSVSSSLAPSAGTTPRDTESWRCEGAGPFCLGMGDMCGCSGGAENVPPNVTPTPTSAPKPKKLKLSLQKPRFECVSDEDMSTICKGVCTSQHRQKYEVECYCV